MHAQLLDPVDFDGSQAIEMEVKWSRQTAETGPCYYVRDLAGIPNNNVLFFYLAPEIRSWRTYRVLDTNNVYNPWPVGTSARLEEFDADGVPPMEYINSHGIILRLEEAGKSIVPVDTVGRTFQHQYRSDINGDGLLDVVYRSENRDRWFMVTFAGNEAGKGIERSFEFPRLFTSDDPLRDRQAMRLFRCGDGQLRLVYCGTPRKGHSGIWLLDVHLEKRDTGWSVEYTVADSIVQRYTHDDQNPSQPRVVWPVTCVDDPNTKRQWAIVNWQQGYHRAGETTVLYEVTNGKLEERMVHRGVLTSSIGEYHGFDEGEAVVMFGKSPGMQVSRVSTLWRPFAWYKATNVGSGVFIDDQYGDATRDLFATMVKYDNLGYPYGLLSLVNFDLRPNSVPAPTSDTTWASLQGSHLLVRLAAPTTLTVDAVHPDGRSMPLHRQALQPGEHRIDLSEKLGALPIGAAFLRVTDGRRVATIPYLK